MNSIVWMNDFDKLSPDTDLRNDPVFPIARDEFISNLIELCAERRHHSRLLLEVGRLLTMTAIVGLHAAEQPDRRETWATSSRLQAEMGKIGALSRNRIDTFVAYLERYGFLEKRRCGADKRVTLLTPTERMLWIDARFLGLVEASAGRLSSEPQAPPLGGPPPARHLALRHEMMLRLPDVYRQLRRHGDILNFLERDSGYLVLLLLLHSADGPERLDTTLPYDRSAALASVSRTHVRLIVEDAERAGLLSIVESGGRRIRLSPKLWRAADHWFADLFGSFHAFSGLVAGA